MAGHAQLPHQEDVQRRVQRLGDFKSNRHATAWQRQDQDVRTVRIGCQLGSQLPTCVVSVAKEHGSYLLVGPEGETNISRVLTNFLADAFERLRAFGNNDAE